MSEINYGKPPKLRLPGDPRFDKTLKFLRDKGASQFFGSARLSPGYTGYFRVLRLAVKTVQPLRDEEQPAYEKWLMLDSDAVVTLGEEKPLSKEQYIFLASRNDPAMFIINSLETIREEHFPTIEHDYSVSKRAFTSMALFAAGVHRDTIFTGPET
ncbi:hypothetical protein BH10PAT3_BH10PAT3_2180 [soil metagenome]